MRILSIGMALAVMAGSAVAVGYQAAATQSAPDVIERYRKAFDQESVLSETASVCISS